MAATTSANGTYATGAGKDTAEMRRRNVGSYENANGGTTYKMEAEDTKKLQKVQFLPPRMIPCPWVWTQPLISLYAVQVWHTRLLG